MIIDMHAHTFPREIAARALSSMQRGCHAALFSDGTEEGLNDREECAGVDLAVVQPVATNPDKVSHVNDAVLCANARWQGGRLLSFGAIHPACPCWERELERLKEAGVKGVKLHPPYEGIDIDDVRTIKILRKCRDLDLIVLTHSGKDIGLPGAYHALPEKIRRALDAVGPMKFIAAHMAGWRCWDYAADCLWDTGIYLDTAFSLGTITPADDGHPWQENDLHLLGDQAFCDLARRFGLDHVLFGTDSPWADPEMETQKIKKLPLSAAEVNAILGENARRLLQIDWRLTATKDK